MREFIISASLVGSLIIFAFVIKVPENLLMFVLFGIIPGTSKVLSPLEMQQVWFILSIIIATVIFGPRLADYLNSTKRSI